MTTSAERFADMPEPDEAFFLASEQQETDLPRPPRRALAVLVSDHTVGSGPDTDSLVTELLQEGGFQVDGVVQVKNKKSQIREAIETAVVGGVDLVITVGGTGVSPRDKTPEATRPMLDKQVPGIAQALRASGQSCGLVEATCSRGIAGVSGSTVIVNLAASRSALRDGMALLPPLVHHLIDQLQKYSL